MAGRVLLFRLVMTTSSSYITRLDPVSVLEIV